jgi:hypothetical protein
MQVYTCQVLRYFLSELRCEVNEVLSDGAQKIGNPGKVSRFRNPIKLFGHPHIFCFFLEIHYTYKRVKVENREQRHVDEASIFGSKAFQSVDTYLTTRCYNTKDHNLSLYRRGNLKSRILPPCFIL